MAFTFAGRWGPEIFLDASQNLMRVKPINVYNKGTLVLATLYTDRTKGTTAANPFITDGFGNGTFFADPGEYDINYGGQTYTITVPMDSVEAQGDGPPTGPAGGDLGGNFPNPTLSTAKQAELTAKLTTTGRANNSVPVSISGTLADLAMGASTILARLASGNIVAATPAQLKSLLAIAQADVTNLVSDLSTITTNIAAKISASLFDANTILKADTDNTPVALTMGASTILARLAAGNIVTTTPAQIKTLLGLDVLVYTTLLGSGTGVVTVTHNLNSTNIRTIMVRKESTQEYWSMKAVVVNANSISLDFGTYVRTANEFHVLVGI